MSNTKYSVFLRNNFNLEGKNILHKS